MECRLRDLHYESELKGCVLFQMYEMNGQDEESFEHIVNSTDLKP